MHARLILGAIAMAGLFGPMTGVQGEDRSTWFKGLKQPGTNNYCCDVSDCKKTEADWRDGQWWAIVQGVWTPIPRDRELSEESIDGEAYVCSGWARRIFCFIPPTMTM